MCTLERARPNDEIVLIGPVVNPPAGKLPNNVNLLRACGHAAALKAMKQFHVGLISFNNNPLTAVDPIKYHEYRAFGLPVISEYFGEMSFRSGECGVLIIQSESDVSKMAQFALKF